MAGDTSPLPVEIDPGICKAAATFERLALVLAFFQIRTSDHGGISVHAPPCCPTGARPADTRCHVRRLTSAPCSGCSRQRPSSRSRPLAEDRRRERRCATRPGSRNSQGQRCGFCPVTEPRAAKKQVRQYESLHPKPLGSPTPAASVALG